MRKVGINPASKSTGSAPGQGMLIRKAQEEAKKVLMNDYNVEGAVRFSNTQITSSEDNSYTISFTATEPHSIASDRNFEIKAIAEQWSSITIIEVNELDPFSSLAKDIGL